MSHGLDSRTDLTRSVNFEKPVSRQLPLKRLPGVLYLGVAVAVTLMHCSVRAESGIIVDRPVPPSTPPPKKGWEGPDLSGFWNGSYVRVVHNEDSAPISSRLTIGNWNTQNSTFGGDWDGYRIVDGKMGWEIGVTNPKPYLTWKHEEGNRRYTCTATYEAASHELKTNYFVEVLDENGKVKTTYAGSGTFKD